MRTNEAKLHVGMTINAAITDRTNPRHREEETQNPDSHNTVKVKLPAFSSSVI